jgi:hypothetical protein
VEEVRRVPLLEKNRALGEALKIGALEEFRELIVAERAEQSRRADALEVVQRPGQDGPSPLSPPPPVTDERRAAPRARESTRRASSRGKELIFINSTIRFSQILI